MMINFRPNSDASPSRRRRRWDVIMDYWNCSSGKARHYGHVSVAIVFFVIAQLLTCALNEPFWKYGIDFPGEIVAMVFVWLFMWAVQLAFFHPGEGLERVYYRYLKAPTEVLNKHMSIGFTVPFLSLISQSFAGKSQVGLLTTAFVVTGILNAGLVYTLAYHVQSRLTKVGPRTLQQNEHVLNGTARAHADISHLTRPVPTFNLPQHHLGSLTERGGDQQARDHSSRLDRFPKHVSDVSTLCRLSGYTSDYNGSSMEHGDEENNQNSFGQPEDALRTLESGPGTFTPESVTPQRAGLTKACCTWAMRNVFLTLSIFVFLVPGLLLSFLQSTDFSLDVGFLFTVWLTFTSVQTRVKRCLSKHHPRPHHMKALIAITTLLNPVLWTSLALLCYVLAKANIRGVPAATIVAQFKTDATVSDLIADHFSTTSTGSPPFGAGDMATSILNAGIVSWGLKLFEYRAPLLSRGGLTVLLTSAIAAAINVVAWPILASRVLGVRPSASALSFAARSVTIALGGPAVARLGGDAGINAVGVVVNGIVFQLVAGCFVGDGSFGGRMTRCRALLGAQARRASFWRWPARFANSDQEKTHAMQTACQQHAERGRVCHSSDATQLRDGQLTPFTASCSPEPVFDDDVRKVAAGVTIGINAAAMGTAHLYEQTSGSAAYSALAMTVFGVFTVLFTVPSPMVVWLRAVIEA